jgi:NAD(P)-dependent dehydrogenase (short-subunit alcohol dehydrogenase family)
MATVRKLAAAGARVMILDLPTYAGQSVADSLGEVVSIAPGLFDTPILLASARKTLAPTVPHPARLGNPMSTPGWRYTSSRIRCSTVK